MGHTLRAGFVLLLAVSSQAAVLTICSSGCIYGPTQLQPAVNAANPGDIVTIDPASGASTVTGLMLPVKTNPNHLYVTIRSSHIYSLPANTRVSPADSNLATITYTFPGYLTMTAAQGAGYYRFEGIKFTIYNGDATYNMIQFGTLAGSNGSLVDNQLSQLVHDIEFDRCAFMGYQGIQGPLRAIMANMGRLLITNSYFGEIKNSNSESQDIAGWNAAGPFYFRNNHFEAAAMETIFGGAVPTMAGLRAKDLTFLGNEYYRPWVWRFNWGGSDPGYGGCLYDARGGEWYGNNAGSGIGTGLFNCSNLGVYTPGTPLVPVQDGANGFTNSPSSVSSSVTFPSASGEYQSENLWIDPVYCATSACSSTTTLFAATPPSFEYAPNTTQRGFELGMLFESNQNGYIKGVRIYKNASDTNALNASLWTTGGTQLATVANSGSPAAGWYEIDFASPQAISAGTPYVASIHTTGGWYAQWNFFRQLGMTDGTWQTATAAQISQYFQISGTATGTSDPTGACSSGGLYQNTATPSYWYCNSGAWTQVTLGQWLSPYGTYYLNLLDRYYEKNHFELKNAERAVVEGNYLHQAWLPAAAGQHGAAFLFNQVDNDDTGYGYPPFEEPAAVVRDVTVRYNFVSDTPWGVSMGTQGSGYFHPMTRIKIENNIFNIGNEPESTGDNVFAQSGSQEKIGFFYNTIVSRQPNAGYAFDMYAPASGITPEEAFVGNIVAYQQKGFYAETGNGQYYDAIDNTWGYNRELSKNVVVDDEGTGWVATNLLTPSTHGLIPCSSCANPVPGSFNLVGFVNYAGGYGDSASADYHLQASSPYIGTWAHGKPAGADINQVNWSTAHALDGLPNAFLDFRVRAVSPARTSASLLYTAYDAAACSLTVSARPDFASPVFTGTDSGGDMDRAVSVTGLSAGTRYYYLLGCDGYTRDGQFLTTP